MIEGNIDTVSTVASVSIPGITDFVEVGRGGFGVVYRAFQTELGRTVAVKVLSVSLDETARNRFERERLAMGSLSGHPNIVTIHDWGFTDQDRPFLLMEFLAEGSLRDEVQSRGALSWTRAFEVGMQIGGALETAHQAEVLHRDIKPANVFVSELGIPKLGDFGIATTGGATATKIGSITASIAHAPPEILNGDRPSPQTDVYSLASTLYELATGAAPFAGEAGESIAAMISRIVSVPAQPPTTLGETFPREAWAVLERALQKDPAQRYPTALEFAAALGARLTEAGHNAPRIPVRSDLASDATVVVPRSPEVQQHLAGAVTTPQSVAQVAPPGTGPGLAAGSASPSDPNTARLLVGGAIAALVLLVGFLALRPGSTAIEEAASTTTTPTTAAPTTAAPTTVVTTAPTTTPPTVPVTEPVRPFVIEGEAPSGTELIRDTAGVITFGAPRNWDIRTDEVELNSSLAQVSDIWDSLGFKYSVLTAGTSTDVGGFEQQDFSQPYILVYASRSPLEQDNELLTSFLTTQYFFEIAPCGEPTLEDYESSKIIGVAASFSGCNGTDSGTSHIAGRLKSDPQVTVYIRFRHATVAQIFTYGDILESYVIDADALL